MRLGRLRQIAFHAPLVAMWLELLPMMFRMPWDATHRMRTFWLWFATVVILPMAHWLAELFDRWIASDMGAAAYFYVTALFALEGIRIVGLDRPWRILLFAVLAVIELLGCAGILLNWRGFERISDDAELPPSLS